MKDGYEKKGYLLEDFRLFHLNDVQGAKMDYHFHEFCKILFLVSGTGGYFIEGKRYLLQAGDIVLVGNQCVHRPEFESGVPYERMILYISPDFLERQSASDGDLKECFFGEHGHVLRPDRETGNLIFSQVRNLEAVMRDMRYGRTIVSSSILLQILVEIVRGFYYRKGQTPDPVLPESGWVQEMIQYLNAHLTEEIKIEELSERFYMSRFHMMRRFKEETGMTIHGYLSDRRLLLAKEYMNHGAAATDACFRCGFQSYASFSRAYGKFFGTTPTGRRYAAAAKEETYE